MLDGSGALWLRRWWSYPQQVGSGASGLLQWPGYSCTHTTTTISKLSPPSNHSTQTTALYAEQYTILFNMVHFTTIYSHHIQQVHCTSFSNLDQELDCRLVPNSTSSDMSIHLYCIVPNGRKPKPLNFITWQQLVFELANFVGVGVTWPEQDTALYNYDTTMQCKALNINSVKIQCHVTFCAGTDIQVTLYTV